MSDSINITDLLKDEAEAKLTAYDAKFVEASAKPPTPEQDYLRKYIYIPSGIDTDKIRKVEMPIPMSAAELQLFKGRRHFRRNSTRFVRITHAPYDAGEKEYYKTIAAMDWVGFNTSPARLAKIGKTWLSKNACILLNTAESATCWDGGTFVSASKPCNPFKKGSTTYKSFWSGVDCNATNVEILIAEMCKRRDFNGDTLGYEGTVLFASPDLYPTARSICADDYLPNGATNPAKKWGLRPEKWSDLDAARWGILHEDEDRPVFGGIEGADELNTWDRTSAMFEQSGEMGYSFNKDLGVALLRSESISLAVDSRY